MPEAAKELLPLHSLLGQSTKLRDSFKAAGLDRKLIFEILIEKIELNAKDDKFTGRLWRLQLLVRPPTRVQGFNRGSWLHDGAGFHFAALSRASVTEAKRLEGCKKSKSPTLTPYGKFAGITTWAEFATNLSDLADDPLLIGNLVDTIRDFALSNHPEVQMGDLDELREAVFGIGSSGATYRAWRNQMVANIGDDFKRKLNVIDWLVNKNM